MNRLLKRIAAIMLTMAVVCMIGCKKADDPSNGGNNGNNGGNGGETPEAPAIVSTSEVQYDGTVFIEAVFEDETKMYFAIVSPTEVSVANGEFFYQDNPSLAYKYRGEVIIPETISHLGTTYTVVAIGYKAFFQCDLVTSVYIPNTVVSIDSYVDTHYNYGSFQDCTNLNSIHLSKNLRIIGDRTFEGCPCFADSVTISNNITSIGKNAFDSKIVVFCADSCTIAGGYYKGVFYSSFPNMNSISFTNNVKILPAYLFSSMNPTEIDIPPTIIRLADWAFRGCTNLEKINGLDNVVDIGYRAFYECESLNSVSLNSSLTNIRYGVFLGCRSLSFIKIPNSVTTIGANAFERSGLQSIEWGGSIDTIEAFAFSSCPLFELSIPNSVSYIGGFAFSECNKMTSLVIGNSVTIIEPAAFYSCYELESVTLGNAVTSIGANAFSGCDKLTEIILPSSIESLGTRAFDSYFSYPNSITCLAINPPMLGEDVFGDRWIEAVYVPMSSVEAYKTADGWSPYADVIVGI